MVNASNSSEKVKKVLFLLYFVLCDGCVCVGSQSSGLFQSLVLSHPHYPTGHLTFHHLLCKCFKESQVFHLSGEHRGTKPHRGAIQFKPWSFLLQSNMKQFYSFVQAQCRIKHLLSDCRRVLVFQHADIHLRPGRGRRQRVLGSVLLHCAGSRHDRQSSERPLLSIGIIQMCCITMEWIIQASGAPIESAHGAE